MTAFSSSSLRTFFVLQCGILFLLTIGSNALVFPVRQDPQQHRLVRSQLQASSREESQVGATKVSKSGIRHLSEDGRDVREAETATRDAKIKYNIQTVQELDAYFADEEKRFRKDSSNSNSSKKNGLIDWTALIRSLCVKGDTQIIGSPDRPDYTHPVVKLLHERRRNGSVGRGDKFRPEDGCRIAVAIEGGGMRGCVSAGMACALYHLNLNDCIDAVYGSSAGSITGAYLITGQLPWFGPEVYYDRLTTAGKSFIDSSRILQSLGFGLLDPRLYKHAFRPHKAKPVLNLDFLLKTTIQGTKPLDWDKFVERQKVMPLNVVVSGVKSEKTIVLGYDNGGFESLEELGHAMHASCLLPGIAGPAMNINKRALEGKPLNGKPKYVLGNNLEDDDYEPLLDALVYEPLPFRSAVKDGATHVVVLRSRPDGVDVTGKGGLAESLIFRRFFRRKNRLPRIYQRMTRHLHKKQYAEDVIRLNEAAYSERDHRDAAAASTDPHLLPIALPPGSEEITRLETRRDAILNGFRRGFARAYDCLVEDPAERGRGTEVAKQFFPDEILEYDPLEIDETFESAFAVYMRTKGVTPKAWKSSADEDAFSLIKS